MSAALAPVLEHSRPVRPSRRHLQLVPEPGPAQPARSQSVARLTVRGRRVALTLIAALALLAAMAVSAMASGPAAEESVTVRSGQTLSDVARQELPQLPVGTAVAHLQMANQLNSMNVSTGQRLVVPAS